MRIFFILFISIYFTSFSQELTFKQVQDSINSIIQQEDIPGVSLAIINKKDSLYWSGGFGMSDIENKIPMSENSIMFIASTSKNFIALGIMKLVEEGKIKLTTPIKDIVPEINYKNSWKETCPITVAMVLEHTSGFDDTRYNNFIGNDEDIFPLKDLLNNYPNALNSRWKPGTMFSYSNINYTLAGYLIEIISGMSFEAYIKQTIVDPLQMNQTKLEGPTKAYPNLTIPYYYDSEKQKNVPLFSHTKVGKNFLQRPASFIITSSKDMLKYLDFYLTVKDNDSLIVSEASIDRMENGLTSYDSKLKLDGRYGLGTKPLLREKRTFGHNGNAWNTTYFMYNRDMGVGYYLSTNCGYRIPEIRRLLGNFLFQGHSFNSIREHGNSDIAKPFEGFYEAITSRNKMLLFFDQIRFAGNLEVENDTIYFDGGLKSRKYKAFNTSTDKLVTLNRLDKKFEKQRNLSSMGLMYDENNEPIIIWDSGTSIIYFKKKSAFIHYFKHISLFASPLILALASLLILIISLIKLIKKTFSFSIINTSIILLTISFCLMFYLGVPNGPFDMITLGIKNVKTVGFFILSIFFPFISIVFLANLIRTRRKKMLLWLKISYAIICFSIVYLNIFMLKNGFIALQFWNY